MTRCVLSVGVVMSDGEEKFVHQGPKDGIVPVISLRDYFAAAALQGLLPLNTEYFDAHDAADWAYDYADAMLEARDQDTPTDL
jgi:hypothetical protein